IKLEGGMEGCYKAGYSKAMYLCRKAEKLLAKERAAEALVALLGAREALVTTHNFPSGEPLGYVARQLRIGIGERLGVLLIEAGRDKEAKEEFENVGLLSEGGGIRYLQAWQTRLEAKRKWHERNPEEALALFLKARSLAERTERLPTGVSAEDFTQLREDLNRCIEFLKGAEVEPTDPSGK
ncbi:MAG: hypothetical protein WCJ66_10735, partial [Verrucomicrobiota bacterium]